MKPMTTEWIAKAQGDFAVMQREIAVDQNPNYDAVCFHAQQCCEKYTKALLFENGVSFGKIHDLVALLESAIKFLPEIEEFREDMAYLTDFSVNFRYPGEFSRCYNRKGRLQQMFQICKFYKKVLIIVNNFIMVKS